ncbi:MAG TPA: hypothetical protein PKD85_01025 [Saprospiraceae bacterium]|nr:hypothetical protein [Saprospiraceae bacterium]
MNKDILDVILKMYLSDFTFDKLFGLCETHDDTQPIIDEILNIPKLKSVCKRWKLIIINYMNRYWGLKLKNTKKCFANFFELKSSTSLRHILMGDMTYATKDKYWGTIRILTLKRVPKSEYDTPYNTPYVVRYINFHLGVVPKINIAIDIQLNSYGDHYTLNCIPGIYCFYSFSETVNKFLFKRNVGPFIKFKECECSKEARHVLSPAFPSTMKDENIIFVPPLNKLDTLFPSKSMIAYTDIIDMKTDMDKYILSSPYYKSVHADIKRLKDHYFFQGLCI